MIRGDTVVVLRPSDGESDPFGAATKTYTQEEVSNVLFAPSSTSDLGEDRPEGVSVDVAFHFPKGYSEDLKECRIAYDGRTYEVIGSPIPYMTENVPGSFGMEVAAREVLG